MTITEWAYFTELNADTFCSPQEPEGEMEETETAAAAEALGYLPVSQARVFGDQENSDPGDVVGLTEAPERRPRDHCFLEIAGHDAAAVRTLGLDAARRNGVISDFSRSQFLG